MRKLLSTFLLYSIMAFSAFAGEKKFAYSEQTAYYANKVEKFKLSLKQARKIVLDDRSPDKLPSTSPYAWIVGDKYYFPDKSSLLTINNKIFREVGAYVDGNTGQIEYVRNPKMNLHLLKPDSQPKK
jgi:hypothetical protein